MTTDGMTTGGIEGLYVETRNYGATAAFWRSLGYETVVETEHNWGQWVHPSGGPYVFIAERLDGDLETSPVLAVADTDVLSPARPLDVDQPFERQHWGVLEAIVRDPDGRRVRLHAPGGDRG